MRPLMILLVILLTAVGGLLFHLRPWEKINLPYLTANSILVMDADSGRVLYEKDADSPRSPSSLTKLMTMLLIFDDLEQGKLSLDDSFQVTPNQANTPGSKFGLEPGQTVTVEQLIAGVILPSGCDCVQCLVALTAGNEEAFVTRMNAKAANLGLKGTAYVNATGLDADGHYMTARDLAVLSKALVDTHPDYLSYSSQAVLEVDGLTFQNLNRLAGRDSRVLGLKTGTTRIGGNNLVTYAQQDDRRYIIVLLDSSSVTTRFSETETILDVLYGEDGHGE